MGLTPPQKKNPKIEVCQISVTKLLKGHYVSGGGLKTALAWHVAATLLRTFCSGAAGVPRADRFGALAAAAFLLAFPRRALV